MKSNKNPAEQEIVLELAERLLSSYKNAINEAAKKERKTLQRLKVGIGLTSEQFPNLARAAKVVRDAYVSAVPCTEDEEKLISLHATQAVKKDREAAKKPRNVNELHDQVLVHLKEALKIVALALQKQPNYRQEALAKKATEASLLIKADRNSQNPQQPAQAMPADYVVSALWSFAVNRSNLVYAIRETSNFSMAMEAEIESVLPTVDPKVVSSHVAEGDYDRLAQTLEKVYRPMHPGSDLVH